MLSILIVDDCPDTGWSFARLLDMYSCQTDYAPNAQAAVELARGKHYDAAVLDYNMPGINGVELMIYLHEISPSTKMFIMTGNDVVLPEGFPLPCPVLRKPFSIKKLVEMLFDGNPPSDV